MALDSEVIYRLRQQIIDSWHDHDGGTPVEAARHYGEEARLIPAFDNSGAVEGQESIRSWFEFQRQKFGPESRWDFQHRVTGFHFQLSDGIVRCRQRLLTTGQKKTDHGELRTFFVPGSCLDAWQNKQQTWQIISREIEVDFAAYAEPQPFLPLNYPGHG